MDLVRELQILKNLNSKIKTKSRTACLTVTSMVSSKQVLLFVLQQIQGLNFGSENIVIFLHNQNLPILSGEKLIVIFEKKSFCCK